MGRISLQPEISLWGTELKFLYQVVGFKVGWGEEYDVTAKYVASNLDQISRMVEADHFIDTNVVFLGEAEENNPIGRVRKLELNLR